VFDQYKQPAPTTNKAYGGENIARGGNAGALEGNWTPNRIVTQGFDGVDTAKVWLNSPEFQEARSIRRQEAKSRTIAIDGM
jgi:uncharacterized protein (DUF1330 family)